MSITHLWLFRAHYMSAKSIDGALSERQTVIADIFRVERVGSFSTFIFLLWFCKLHDTTDEHSFAFPILFDLAEDDQ
jgi:hypothetical protein